ncbi:MAG: MoaD/ThiS family protein [Anaerolineae bacterium]
MHQVVRVQYRDQVWEMDPRMTVRQLIEEVDLIPETVLAVRDGQLLSDDAVLEAGDEVKLIAVISGG